MNYNAKKIAHELKQTALGASYFGNALRVAKDIPGLTDEDRSVLDRYATGTQKGTDHVKLQDIANRLLCFHSLVEQYRHDAIGQKLWPNLPTNNDYAAIQDIFLKGACFDFAAALSDMTGWPVYEIQCSMASPDDPDETGGDHYVHRVVAHPSGRYLDASGWTNMQSVIARAQMEHTTHQWMGQVDPDSGTFDVDFDLVKQAVAVILPEDACLQDYLSTESDSGFKSINSPALK